MITRRRSKTMPLALVVLVLVTWQQCKAFQSIQPSSLAASTRLHSSIGNGPPGDKNNKNGGKDWGDFMSPRDDESEHMRRAREYLSENSLPISFDAATAKGLDSSQQGSSSDNDIAEDDDDDEDPPEIPAAKLALVMQQRGGMPTELTPEMVASNPYIAVVTRLSPSELIARFGETANPSVQNAVRTTILGLIGGLPKLAFDTTMVTSGQRLASLMFQLQMTGYMFKNAEYRQSLETSLKNNKSSSSFALPGSIIDNDDDDDDEDTGEKAIDFLNSKVRGKVRIKFGSESDSNNDYSGIEVDADAYMSELRDEVARLRDELSLTRQSKQEAINKDLLAYIRTLPPQELKTLTGTVSEDVIVAMKGLVNAVISGIGEGQIQPDTVVEQSSDALAQLCMWQLVIGYNLRTLEVREEFKKSLGAGKPNKKEEDDTSSGSVGAFE